LISGRAEPSVDFWVSVAVVFYVPGEVVPDALLAVPCVVDEGVLLPGQMRQKGEGDGGRD
jgi:hypothetical protein